MCTSVDSAYIERLHEDINIACQRLEEKGYESLVITVSFDGHVVLGSQKGRMFLADRYDFLTDFIQCCGDEGAVIKAERETASPESKKTKTLLKKLDSNSFDTDRNNTYDRLEPPEITEANIFDDDTDEYDKTEILESSLLSTFNLENNNEIDEYRYPEVNIEIDEYINEDNVQTATTNEEAAVDKEEKLDLCNNDIPKGDARNILDGKVVVTRKSKRGRKTVLRSRKSVRDNTKIVKKKTNASCDICGKQLVNMRMVATHKIMYHQQSEGPHDCDICGAKFKTQRSVKIHRKRHSKPKHKCEICGKESFWLCDQARHMRVHTNEKPYVCETCGKAFSAKPLLDNHFTLHTGEKRFKCSFEGCRKVFRRWDSLRKHLCYHSTEYAFICDFCGKKFKEKTCMVHHRKFHLIEFRWPCDYCEEKFKTCGGYKSHIARLHTDKMDEVSQRTNIKFYPCSTCSKVFGEKKEFDQHMNIHLGLKPFLCGFCEKAFSSRSNMLQHKKTHTGERKLRCKFCSKTYSEPKMFKTHLKNKHDQTVDS